MSTYVPLHTQQNAYSWTNQDVNVISATDRAVTSPSSCFTVRLHHVTLNIYMQVISLSSTTNKVSLSFHCHHICCQLLSPLTACTCLWRFNYELQNPTSEKPSLIKVCLVISHWRIRGDNNMREWTWFVCPCFLRLTSLFSFFLKHCCATTQRKIVPDCKSTLNQHWDGKHSLISQQQSVFTALKSNVIKWKSTITINVFSSFNWTL